MFILNKLITPLIYNDIVSLFLFPLFFFLGDGSDVDVSLCEQLLCEAMDLRNSMTRVAYSKGDEVEACRQLLDGQKSDGSLRKLENWLHGKSGANKLYFVGSKLSAPDFHIFEMLDQYTQMADFHGLDMPLDALPHLKAFYNNFRQLPQNQAYLNSALHTLPFNQKMAKFGGAKNRGKWNHKTMVEGTDHYDFANISGVFGGD